MSDELTDFEQRLVEMQPNSTVDRDDLIFASGQASAKTSVAEVLRWKILSVCSTAAAMLLLVGLIGSQREVSQSRQREVALLERLSSSEQSYGSTEEQAISEAASNKSQSPPRNEPPNSEDLEWQVPSSATPNLAENTQHRLRDTALSQGVMALPSRPESSRRSRAVSWGDARRVLAMVNESRIGLRRIDSLRPQ